MRSNISRIKILTVAIALLFCSCIRDAERGTVGPVDPIAGHGSVTFMVSAPSSESAADGTRTRSSRPGATRSSGGGIGANGHFPEGVPADYTNYSPGADIGRWGTLFGGYPDAETEAEAFRTAVAAMAANYENSPAARAADLARRMNSSGGATRAIERGSAADNRIDEIAVLLFAPDPDVANPSTDDDYVLAAVKRAGRPGEPALKEVSGNGEMRQFTIENLADNSYRALFVANSRDELEAFITSEGGETAAKGTLTLEDTRTGLEISSTRRWNTDPTDGIDDGDGVFRPFPMSMVVDFAMPNTVDYAVRPIELARALARIDVRSSIPGFEIVSVALINAERNGRLVPAAGWSKSLTLPEAVNPAGGSVFGYAAGDFPADHTSWSSPLSWQVPATGVLEDEIFVFERAAVKDPYDPDYNDNLGLIVAARHGSFPAGGVRYFRVSLAHSGNGGGMIPVDIVRNYAYTVDITECNTLGYETVGEAVEHPDELVVSVLATDQGGATDVTFNGRYQLTTDRSVVVIPAGQKATLSIYTDYAGGWTITPGADVETTVGGVAKTSSGAANIDNEPDRIEIAISSPASPAVSTRSMNIVAGELHKTVTLVVLPPAADLAGTATSESITRYVGAFWRADQTGERLISLDRAAVDTDWSAFVLDAPADSPADWVVMDTRPTSDTDIWAAAADQGNHADFDRLHPVNSIVNWATGTAGANPRENYFRLGARNDHGPTPHAPARYATVLVVSGRIDNGTLSADVATYRLLYLRQGHDPDRLFTTAARPSEANMRFSPYNLTVPATGMGALADAERGSVELPLQGGAFTDYPTQAGAHFKGAGPLVRRAFAPWLVFHPDWMGDGGHTQPFDPRTDETCPPGYRRPTGADTQAEIPQSLWRNPAAGAQGDNTNSVFGFYADGFFDRRTIETQQAAAPIPLTAVAPETPQVAYWGALLHGQGADGIPTSIFFPAAGRRDHAPMLSDAGAGGFIWSTSWPGAAGPPSGWQGYFRQNPQGPMMPGAGLTGTANLTDGASVRCVAVQDYSDDLIADLALAPPGVIGIRHSDLVRLRAERATNVLGNGYFDPSITLTLRGSSTYRGTWVERIATTGENATLLGRLEDEPVYAVYFKWGSTVAVIGGAVNDPFDAGDVVWVNPGFTAATNTWAGFTPATPLGHGVPDRYDIPAHVAASGWGDACDFVGGASAANPSGWKTPTGPWKYSDGTGDSYPFGRSVSSESAQGDQLYWDDPTISARWTDEFGGGGVSDDGMIFLAAVGWRDDATGMAHWGLPYVQYSTATISPYYGPANMYRLGFWREHISTPEGDVDIASPIRCVHPVAVEQELQMAAPGTIGIRKSDYDALRRGDKTPGDGTYSLTLRGSSTWRNHPSGIDVNNTASIPGLAGLGGLETEPVYAVYFKWGSTVGMVGGPDGSAFDAKKVVWVNPEYNLAQHPITDYGDFTAAAQVSAGSGRRGIDNNVVENLRIGHGDPCMWVDGNTPQSRFTAAGGWRTPTFQENRDLLGGVYQLSTGAGYTWRAAEGIGVIGQGLGNGMGLVAGGMRDADGNMSQTAAGGLWTSTVHSNGANPVAMDFNDAGIQVGGNWALSRTVRCVRDVPGTPVPRGVIGYFVDGPKAGELTLDGDKQFYDNPTVAPESRSIQNQYTVHAAFFKWGSLVATDGSNDGDDFTAADIIAVPKEYTGGAAGDGTPASGLPRLRRQVEVRTTANDRWGVIQPLTGLTAGQSIPTNPSTAQLENAQGDPCAYWFGASWRMPSRAENITLSPANGYSFQETTNSSVVNPHWLMHDGLRFMPVAGWRMEIEIGGGRVGNLNGLHIPSSVSAGEFQSVWRGYSTFWGTGAPDGSLVDNMMHTSSGSTIRCVRQMLAAQGVIGYFADGPNKGQLTLSGSKEYRGTPHDPAVHGNMQFGPLSQHTVYAAYFKFGSAIAIGSEPTNNGVFGPQDVIAGPSGYNLTTLRNSISSATTAETKWEKIVPFSTGDWPTAANNTNGQGDPCRIYFPNFPTAGKNWKVPVGGVANGGWNGGTFGTAEQDAIVSWPLPNGAIWIDNTTQQYGNMPAPGAVAGKDGAPDWTIFVPQLRRRINTTGNFELDADTRAFLWSSTANWSMMVFHRGSMPNLRIGVTHAWPVRCVPQ